MLKKYCILLSEGLFTFTNSVDPDKMKNDAYSLFAKVLV